jgi:hypothetical protein
MGFTEMETGIPLIEDRLPAALAAEHGGIRSTFITSIDKIV